MKKTIGILTGGGDVPGLNPCIKAVVTSALEEGYRVFGITRGWAGLLQYDPNDPSTHVNNVRNLEMKDVRTVDRTGGTFLHTSRTNPSNMHPEKVPDFLKNTKWGTSNDEKGTLDYHWSGTDSSVDLLLCAEWGPGGHAERRPGGRADRGAGALGDGRRDHQQG